MFDFPLKEKELKDLINTRNSVIDESIEYLQQTLQIRKNGIYLILPDKEWAIRRRKAAERLFKKHLPYIYRSARLLSYLPFVRCIALTGSASKQVYYPYEDYDFLLITQSSRVWVTQFLVSLFRRAVSLNYHLNYFQNYCCGVILSENNLYVKNQNEFVGLEIVYSKVFYNPRLHLKFLKSNEWLTKFYRFPETRQLLSLRSPSFGIWKSILERACDLFLKITGVNTNLDNILRYSMYKWLKRNRTVNNFQEFSKNNRLTQIISSGNRQSKMVQMLQGCIPETFDDKLRSRALKHNYAKYHTSRIDLLITHGFFLTRDWKERKIGKPYVPLGPLYVASYLRQRNFNVDFYDSTFKGGLWQFRNDLQTFRSTIVGIYAFEPTRNNVISMLEACRVNSFITIVGGPDGSCDPQFYIDHGADMVVIGEGEETLAEILEEFRQPTKNLFQIPGVYMGKLKPFTPRAFIPNLNILPFPARELVHFSQYFHTWKLHHKKTSMSIIISRGCPYHCNWCSKPVFGSQVRRRTPENVVQELTLMRDIYHPDQIWFADDIFPTESNWLMEFHARVIKNIPIIPFECLLRVDLVTIQTLKLLKESGCFRVHFGAESGSRRVLRLMNKKIRPVQILRAARDTHLVGLEVGFFIMLGYPGETINDIELTRKLIRAASPDHISLKIAKPIKGTVFYDYVAQKSSQTNRHAINGSVKYRPTYPKFIYWIAQKIINSEVILTKINAVPLRTKILYKIYLVMYAMARKLIT